MNASSRRAFRDPTVPWSVTLMAVVGVAAGLGSFVTVGIAGPAAIVLGVRSFREGGGAGRFLGVMVASILAVVLGIVGMLSGASFFVSELLDPETPRANGPYHPGKDLGEFLVACALVAVVTWLVSGWLVPHRDRTKSSA